MNILPILTHYIPGYITRTWYNIPPCGIFSKPCGIPFNILQSDFHCPERGLATCVDRTSDSRPKCRPSVKHDCTYILRLQLNYQVSSCEWSISTHESDGGAGGEWAMLSYMATGQSRY
ncbi:hypothetical protein J6590_008730 [Homalodisca vitripennis]|nr:hypothetical protein J6590_008730 [Homalodisca vitripennis]